MISSNGIDLGLCDNRRLELLLKNELYMNIDSVVAEEIMAELGSRNTKTTPVIEPLVTVSEE